MNQNTFWQRMNERMNYRPGYYLTYFIYCMIPVAIYVYYLWQRKKEDDVVPEVTFLFNIIVAYIELIPLSGVAIFTPVKYCQLEYMLISCIFPPKFFLLQESFVQKMKKIINENPWIVALLVVVVGLPISIILYMLCSSSPKKVCCQIIFFKKS